MDCMSGVKWEYMAHTGPYSVYCHLSFCSFLSTHTSAPISEIKVLLLIRHYYFCSYLSIKTSESPLLILILLALLNLVLHMYIVIHHYTCLPDCMT